MNIDIHKLSSKYTVRKLNPEDVDIIYELSLGNPQFYEYCPPFVTRESILQDMKALPPKTAMDDKYYIGFFTKEEGFQNKSLQGEKMVAVMDLIFNYPDGDTAFIGLFMVAKEYQGKGVGSAVVSGCFRYLQNLGYSYVKLAFAKGNPQSEAFWKKNGFRRTGAETDNGDYTAVVMQRALMDKPEIQLEEIAVEDAEIFFEEQYQYLNEDGIITDDEDREYFQGEEYRNLIKNHMQREEDRHHLAYFVNAGKRIGAVSYCIYESEDGKCFILDFWIFPAYRRRGLGQECFDKLVECTKAEGAGYYEINCDGREDRMRFWESLGFVPDGVDEWDMPLLVRNG